MKKIGVSVPWDYLSGYIVTKDAEILKQNFSSAAEFLNFLIDLEVTHIELRHRKKEMLNSEMESVFRLLSDFKLDITIHGDNPLETKRWTVEEVFPWLEAYKTINEFSNVRLMITLHPYKGYGDIIDYKTNTINFIQRLSDEITKQNLQIDLALENQRNKGYIDPGTSFEEIVEMWTEINRSNLGICWDMGHCFSNHLLNSNDYTVFPESNFTKATIHTHIHDIGPDGRTHWVFKENLVPVNENINLLKKSGYEGIYNLELSFDRFASEKDIPILIKNTIIKLREMI